MGETQPSMVIANKRIYVEYSDSVLLNFIDSIKNLNSSDLLDSISKDYIAELNDYENINKLTSEQDFNWLRSAIKQGVADTITARRIWGNFRLGNLHNLHDSSFIQYSHLLRHPIDSFSDFYLIPNHFLGGAHDSYIYRRNKLIGVVHNYNHYGVQTDYFENSKKESIFIAESGGGGTGVASFISKIYQVTDSGVKPLFYLLTRMVEANGKASGRNFNLKSTILDSSAFTVKFVFEQSLVDSDYNTIMFVQDSCITNIAADVYTESKICDCSSINLTKELLHTFNHSYYADLLFISNFDERLKEMLSDKSMQGHHCVRDWINSVVTRTTELKE